MGAAALWALDMVKITGSEEKVPRPQQKKFGLLHQQLIAAGKRLNAGDSKVKNQG
jgi:hypothetical protein